jgi:hypothetical protein
LIHTLRKHGAISAGLATAMITVPAWSDTTQDLEDVGDVLQIVLPATAGIATLFEPVDEGAWLSEGSVMWLKSTGTAIASSSIIKLTVEKTRPNGASLSYPSGHTTIAFSGASFIQRRYGWNWGVPAYATAAFVGWSRINADKHDTFDVLSGATLGIVTTYIFTEPFEVADTSISIEPWTPVEGDDAYYGLRFNLGAVAPLQDDGDNQTPMQLEGDTAPTDPLTRNIDRNTQIWTGTDTTDIVTSLGTNVRLLDQNGEGNRNSSNFTGYIVDVEYDHAIGDHLLGISAGMVKNRSDDFPNGGDWGFGDIEARWKWAPYRNPEATWYQPRAMGLGVDVLLPTGDLDKGTGLGAVYLRPNITFAFTPATNFNIYLTASYFHSFDEESGAQVERGFGLEPRFEYKFPQGVYASWAPEFIFDAKGTEEDTANHRFELGFKLSEKSVLYFQYALIGRGVFLPGTDPTDPNFPRKYDDAVTAGVRFRF